MSAGLVTIVVAVGGLLAIAALFAFLTHGGAEVEDRRGVRLVGLASLGVAIVIGGLTLVQVITTLNPGTAVAVTAPVETVRIEPAPGVTFLDGPAAPITEGGFTSADVVTTGLSAGVRAMLAGGLVLTTAVTVMIAIVIFVVCRRLLAGRPFAESVTRLALAAALVSLIAGFLGQVLTGIAQSQAAHELFFISAAAMDGTSAGSMETGFPIPAFLVQLEFWPVAVAFILGVFATLVRFGSSVQRQRDDLAVETETLRRDTDGLV